MTVIHRALCSVLLLATGCGPDGPLVRDRTNGDGQRRSDDGAETDLCSAEGARTFTSSEKYVCENGVVRARGWPSIFESAQDLIDAIHTDPCSGLESFVNATDFTSDRVALISIEGGTAAWLFEDAQAFRIGVTGSIGGEAPPLILNVVRVPRSTKPIVIQNCINSCDLCP